MTSGQSVGAPKFLAQIGVVVGIAPNPYNTLNDQLQQEKTQLDKQSADLAAREAAFASSTDATGTTTLPPNQYLAIAIVIVGLLVLLNFYLEWRYVRRQKQAISTEQSDQGEHKE
jgi:hypothetical protein